MRARRALVVGAGPAGLATAALLRRTGLEVLLLERAPDDADAGTALTLWPNAFSALAVLGADGPVRAGSAPSAGLAMRTARGGTLLFLPSGVLESRCGGNGRALPRAALLRALNDLQPPDAIRFGARCVGVRQEGAVVAARLADGTEVEGDLLIGADGIRSRVRAALFGAPGDTGGGDLRYLGYAVARGVAAYSCPGHPALLALGAGRQFGLFPLPEGRMYWFAAFAVPEGGARAGPSCLPFLQRHFAAWHDPVPHVLRATDPAAVTVTAIHDRAPLRRWGRGAVALVGDAAHPAAPAMGQGTCQALEDAVVLARALAGAGADDVPAALRAYAARRRHRAHAVTFQSHWSGRVGQWRAPALCAVRDGVIRAAPRSALLGALRSSFTFG
ncbi:FAD-dependent monooxygenase [Streptomyces hesseae]|uniref:FAD-dependent monooxygenase n=1 Tax=Streptomyces hesseae TaxID=3075519 RepID=A0ABU2SPA2_9ACTN|nr:FAD-dependent monooxygenase [Streptomyces sp. DSM 40473]MDT0450801.1 FAD-dependent monooxygenase [Streptomyces sp. DSM 40473]